MVFRIMVQVTDDLSAAVVSSHTLTLVLCFYFCLCASAHNIKKTPIQIRPCGFSMGVCFGQSMALLRGTSASPLYPRSD